MRTCIVISALIVLMYNEWSGNSINNVMKNNNIKNLIQARNAAEKKIKKLNPRQKKNLEVHLDIEHAYYSSALEGSKLDRKTFEELGKKITA